ncbi:MAG: hypothetical protein ACTSUX_03490 [Promethearchaeota archaeon]
MKKKLIGILTLTLVVCLVLLTSALILAAPDHCNAGYVACLEVAGDDTGALNDCLRGWAACAGIPLEPMV